MALAGKTIAPGSLVNDGCAALPPPPPHPVAALARMSFLLPDFDELDAIPPDEHGGWRALRILGLIACAVGVLGVAWDACVLATHQMSVIHRISDIISLAPSGYAAYWGAAVFRVARARLAANRTMPR